MKVSSEEKAPIWLSKALVQALHAESLSWFGGSPGLRDEALLESALGRPRHLLAYGEGPTLFDLAAAYGFGIARNHPFIDGNKRAALLAIRAFLFLNGYTFHPDQTDTVATIEGLAAGEVDQDALSDWIGRHTRPFESR